MASFTGFNVKSIIEETKQLNVVGKTLITTQKSLSEEQKSSIKLDLEKNKSLQTQASLIKGLTEAFKPMITAATKQAEAQEKIAKAQVDATKNAEEHSKAIKEQTETYLDATNERQRFKDSMMEVKHQILEVTQVTKGMDKSMFQAMSQSKLWTAGSRLLSGTGLWSVQNAIRGVIDVVSIYQTAQEKKLEITDKAAKAMENYADVESDYFNKAQKLNKFLKASDHDNLMKESLSYKLLIKRKVGKEDAVKLVKLEVKAMDELLARQKKAIYGGKIRQWFRPKIAKLELKLLSKAESLRDKLFGKKGQAERKEVKWTKEEKDKEGYVEGGIKVRHEPKKLSGREKYVKDFNEKMETVSPYGGKTGIVGASLGLRKKEGGKGLIGHTKGILKGVKKQGVFGDQKARVDFLKTKMAPIGKFLKGAIFEQGIKKKLKGINDNLRGKFKKVLPNMLFVFSKMKVALMYFFMLIIGVFIVFKVISMIWDGMKSVTKGLEDSMFAFFSLGETFGRVIGGVIDWFMALWKIIYSAFTGDFGGMIDGLIELAITTFFLVVDLLLLGLSLLFTIGAGLVVGFIDWIKQPGHMKKLLKGIAAVLVVWTIWAIVKYVAAHIFAGMMALIGAMPLIGIMVGAAILLGLGFIAVYKDEIITFLQGIIGAIREWVGENSKAIGGAIIGAGAGFMVAGPAGAIAGAAVGGKIGAGMAEGGVVNTNKHILVGEKGPELVKLPKGSRVHSNKDSKSMMGSNTINNTINVHVNGRIGASDREVRDIARKVGQLVNTEINRTTSSSSRSVS